MEDEPQWKLPKDTPLPAKLNKVESKLIEFTLKKDRGNKKAGEKDSFTKWEWEFEITGGEFEGLRAWADTEDRLTNHPDNKVRQFAETLRGAPFEMGEGLDTDDLLGLPCAIVVDNIVHTKANGDKTYLSPVREVFPADALAEFEEAPF